MLVASFNELKLPANYHWPTDVPDNVVFGTIARAATVVEGAIRLLRDSGGRDEFSAPQRSVLQD